MVYCAGLENRKCEMDSFGQDWPHLPGLRKVGICERLRVAARGLEWSHFFAAGYLSGYLFWVLSSGSRFRQTTKTSGVA